jgi:hypothetical protein
MTVVITPVIVIMYGTREYTEISSDAVAYPTGSLN